MGVYIKNMKLPDKCGHCRFATAFDCGVDGQFIPTHDARRKDCPLIEVPEPHGQLGDLDELFRTMENKGWFNNADRDIAEDIVINASTIIPAEEDET